MIRAAIFFFLIALVAYILGAFGIAGLSLEMGRILLFVFLIFAGLSIIIGLFSGKKPKFPEI